VVAAGDTPPVADTPKPITLSAESTARLVTIEGLMKRAAGLKPTAAFSTPPTMGPAVVTPVSAAPPAVKPAPVAR